jgi:acetylornithine deacetylase/succinyl-diaminopimelate desuccinylase-like protein
MRKGIGTLVLACAAAWAAEPDWPAVERHALDLLQRYVRIASVNPPADTRAAAALFEAELKAAGLEPKLYLSGPDGQTNLVVRLPGRDRARKPLLLLNHFDVVPVDRAAWGEVDPFGGEIRDGFVWGRGALDMKGLGVMHLTALAAMKAAGVSPPRDIVMLSTADEETSGERGIQWMIANHFDEIDAEYVLDEGGVASRDLLSPGKLVFGVAAGEKQVLWLRLRAQGPAGHGSQPVADSANNVLLAAIARALALPPAPPPPFVAEMERALGAVAPNKFTAAIRGNTISLTSLTSGVGSPPKVNVIPSTAEATLDCRLLPGENPDEFVAGLKARINDPRVTVERLSQPTDAGVSRVDTPLFEALRRAVRAQYPEAVVTPILIPYGTDSVQLRKRGVAAYGFNPMVLGADLVATMHSDSERIPVEEFRRGLRVFYALLSGEY